MRKKEREISDMSEIESIMMNSDVCRIAFADANAPYIVTMNFGYCGIDNRRLYFHCAPEGRKIEMMKKNNFVCFEMDTDHHLKTGKMACDYGMSYRSVVGYGYISIVNDEEERVRALDYILSHYSGNKKFTYKPETLERTMVLRLDIGEISGKQCK
jgi:nitroimidazol reductase NimA-like FMN-containing flavoprotein (pyridoxamine 5'-phosphate oxidase superfamily)